MNTPLFTAHDIQNALLRLEGVTADGTRLAQARQAIAQALHEVFTAHRWRYFYRRGRITTDAAYSTGTIAYDHTGGSSERLLTLSDGTLPANFARGRVLIDNVEYECETRIDATTGTLSVNSNPGADIAAGTAWQWWRDTYDMPVDFQEMAAPMEHDEALQPAYKPPGDLLNRRANYQQASRPEAWSLIGSEDYVGGLVWMCDPAPDDVYQFDFMYRRLPRPIRTFDYSNGTVTVSEGSASVTGSGTTWLEAHEGAVLRFGTTSNAPDGLEGPNPYTEQRIVSAVGSTTGITLDAVTADAHSAVKYRISDLIDLEAGAMFNAFLRCAEYLFAMNLSRKDWQTREAKYLRAIQGAKEADNRFFGKRNQSQHYDRLRYGEITADQG